MDTKYVKLSEVESFTIQKFWGYKWKKWDNDEHKMLVSDKYEQGYKKTYQVDTNEGKMDLSAGQVGSLLEACVKDGVSDLNNKTFSVKTNGKTGMEIRYYLNLVREGYQDHPKEEERNIDLDW